MQKYTYICMLIYIQKYVHTNMWINVYKDV